MQLDLFMGSNCARTEDPNVQKSHPSFISSWAIMASVGRSNFVEALAAGKEFDGIAYL